MVESASGPSPIGGEGDAMQVPQILADSSYCCPISDAHIAQKEHMNHGWIRRELRIGALHVAL